MKATTLGREVAFMADDTARQPRKRKRQYFDATCDVCGGTFRASRRDAKVCSERCHRALRRARQKANPVRKAKLQEQRHQWYLKNREAALERARQQRLRKPYQARASRHGVAEWLPLFTALWEAQDGKCYLCGDPFELERDRPVHLDHDHDCCPPQRSCWICRRGLACKWCNRLAGFARDDPDRLRLIANNLERAKAGVRMRMAEAQGVLFLVS